MKSMTMNEKKKKKPTGLARFENACLISECSGAQCVVARYGVILINPRLVVGVASGFAGALPNTLPMVRVGCKEASAPLEIGSTVAMSNGAIYGVAQAPDDVAGILADAEEGD